MTVANGCEKEGGKESKRKKDGGKKIIKKKDRHSLTMRRKDKVVQPMSLREEYK